jgi:hypothetical protein
MTSDRPPLSEHDFWQRIEDATDRAIEEALALRPPEPSTVKYPMGESYRKLEEKDD